VAAPRLSLWHNIDRRFISMAAAGCTLFRCSGSLLSGNPISRIVAAEAMKFSGCSELNAEYAKQYRYQSAQLCRLKRLIIVKPGFTVCTYQPQLKE